MGQAAGTAAALRVAGRFSVDALQQALLRCLASSAQVQGGATTAGGGGSSSGGHGGCDAAVGAGVTQVGTPEVGCGEAGRAMAGGVCAPARIYGHEALAQGRGLGGGCESDAGAVAAGGGAAVRGWGGVSADACGADAGRVRAGVEEAVGGALRGRRGDCWELGGAEPRAEGRQMNPRKRKEQVRRDRIR